MKLLKGNPGKRRVNDDEFKPVMEPPQCPGHLTGPAKAEWQRLVPELHAYGMVSEVDRAALAMLCSTWGRYVHAERMIAQEAKRYPDTHGLVDFGSRGLPVQSPWVTISTRAIAEYRLWCKEFGLTPDGRIGLRPMTSRPIPTGVPAPGDNPPAPDGWGDFRSGGR